MGDRYFPPGPRGHWLSGSLPEFRRDPLGFLMRCWQEHGDVVGARFYAIKAVLLNGPENIENVLVTQNQKFIKARVLRLFKPVFGNGLLTSEGDFWLRQRRLVQPAFHRDRIASYGKIMVDSALDMLAEWQPGETRDVHQEMMKVTLKIVAKALFGADVSAQTAAVGQTLQVFLDEFTSMRRPLKRILPRSIPLPSNLRFKRAIRELDGIIYSVIRQKRDRGKDDGDLLSMLLRARDEDGSRMTDQQLRDETVTLFLAGHETTAIALSWIWYLLSLHPEVEEELLSELREVLAGRPPGIEDLPLLTYTEKVVMETLRLYPPAWSLGREALEDLEIAGYHLPKGTQVNVSPWVMHRHPGFYPEPERFNPGRWTGELVKRLPKFAYFPFGGGQRVCIGSSFAMMEACLLLATIAQRFRLRVVPGWRIEPWATITLRPRYGIGVEIMAREPGRAGRAEPESARRSM
jgi:cytochrome P450